MAINNLTTSNTFGEWVTTTQQLVATANALTDGPILYCNTQLQLAKVGVTLNVATDALFSGNIIANGALSTLNVTNNVVVSNTLTSRVAVVTQNVTAGNLTTSGSVTTPKMFFTHGFANTGYLAVYDLNVLNAATLGTFSTTHIDASSVDIFIMNVTNSVTATNLVATHSVTSGNLIATSNVTTNNLIATGYTNTATLLFTTGFANTGSLVVNDLTVLNAANVNSLIGNAAVADPVVMAIALG